MSPDVNAVDLALAHSILYEVLAIGLARPTEGAIRRLASASAQRAIAEAAECVDGAAATHGRVPVPRQQPRAATLADLIAEHDSLFGHTPRGRVCPFETEYGPGDAFHQAHELANLAGYYLAFGLEPRLGLGTRVDHVACECEFMSFLCRKEAVAIELAQAAEPGDRDEQAELAKARESLEITRAAQRRFLRDHLARFGTAFAYRLGDEEPGVFYAHLGELLRSLLESECERLDVPVGPPTLHLRPATENDAVPMACGREQGEDELIQIQGLGSCAHRP